MTISLVISKCHSLASSSWYIRYSKKQDLFQNFEKGKRDIYFKCPNCGRFIRRIYENKKEKEYNIPIRERNLKAYLALPKPKKVMRPYIRYINIKI